MHLCFDAYSAFTYRIKAKAFMVYTTMTLACLVCSHSLLPILASVPLYASVALGLLRIVRQVPAHQMSVVSLL